MARKRWKRIELTLGLQITYPKDLQALEDRLTAFIESPELLLGILKQAVAETLLTAYRERFLQNFTLMLHTERAHGSASPRSSAEITQARDALSTAAQALADAQAHDRGFAGAEKKVRKAEEKLTRALDRKVSESPLSTGMFRPLALQVLRLVSEVATLGSGVDQNAVHLGIGNLDLLNAIHTPSATPMLTGHDTASAMDTLWKHLEFGTGVYSTLKNANPGSKHRAKDGGWWYGPHPGFGLHLLGSQGGHFLFDAATGVPYHADALRFEEEFGQHFLRALAGR